MAIVNAAAVSLTLTTHAASIIPRNIVTGVQALALTEQTALVEWDVEISAAAASFTLTENAATVTTQPVVREGLGFSGAVARNAVYVPVVTADLEFNQSVLVSLPKAVTEGFGLADTQVLVVGKVVAEHLGLAASYAVKHTLTPDVSEGFGFSDALLRYLSGAAVESLGLAQTVTPVYRAKPTVTEGLGFTATAPQDFILRVDVSDELGLTDTEAVQALFAPTVTEGLGFSLGFVSPTGDFTVWAVNSVTGAVTEYTNFQFNSFAEMYPHYLGASSTGLYELDGDDDAGTNIIPRIRSGYQQFGANIEGGSRAQLVSLDAAYLAMRGEGDYVLKVRLASGEEYCYSACVDSMRTARVSLGRGMRARYIAFELEGEGDDFDLESLEFLPLSLDRRV